MIALLAGITAVFSFLGAVVSAAGFVIAVGMLLWLGVKSAYKKFWRERK